MSRFMTLPGSSGFGFDSGRSMVVIPVAKRCSVYLIAGGDLKVDVYKEPLNLEAGNAKEIATVTEGDVSKKEASDNTLTEWERQQSIRKFTIEGKSMGRVYVRALVDNLYNFTLPLEIRVVDNGTFGQASKAGAIPQEFEVDLSKLSLKEAAVRVAEDQMHNEVGQSFQSSGSGLYDEPFHLA
ncbi:MAG: hypothetical protein H7Z37_07850 [Pyrinomonadaceae bacterium]|nr:hypothetical protein [Pyrinomonadaceae bacterium]